MKSTYRILVPRQHWCSNTKRHVLVNLTIEHSADVDVKKTPLLRYATDILSEEEKLPNGSNVEMTAREILESYIGCFH